MVVSGLRDFVLEGLDGAPIRLAAGGPTLLALVAASGPLVEQLDGLEGLWRRYRPRRLSVLGIVSPEFAEAPLPPPLELAALLRGRRELSFPVSLPISATGPTRHPLFRWLCGPDSPFPGAPRAPFEKWLCDAEGRLVGRFAAGLPPEAPELVSAVADRAS
ncbi:MAG: hypothetical protein RML12_09790 [Xanthomonadales bacterium]|nr:hypothetical protein [Xanthomonadales bacterium]